MKSDLKGQLYLFEDVGTGTEAKPRRRGVRKAEQPPAKPPARKQHDPAQPRCIDLACERIREGKHFEELTHQNHVLFEWRKHAIRRENAEGLPVQPHDGRDYLTALYEASADLAMYLEAYMYENKEDITEIMMVHGFLVEILKAIGPAYRARASRKGAKRAGTTGGSEAVPE